MIWIDRTSSPLADASDMKKNKTTRITVETERHYLISRHESLFALCEVCGDEVRLVTVNEAVAIAGMNSLNIYRLAEAGTLHYAETGAGELLICTVSLRDLASKKGGQIT
jgi:hypothetical protein